MTTPPPSTEPPDSSAPAGSPPPTTSPTWTPPATGRFAGMTPEQILGIADQQASALEQLATRPQYQPQPTYQPQYPPSQEPPVNESDFADVRTVNRMVEQRLSQAAQPIGQQMQSLYEMQAGTNLSMARDKHADVFKRWGHEVNAKLATVPYHLRTLDNLETIVKMVKADHVEDLAAERARELVAQQDPALRPSGGAGGYPNYQAPLRGIVESEALPADYRNLLQQRGVTDEAVREFCRMNNLSVEQWVDMAKRTRTDVITERREVRNGISQTPQAPPR